MRGQDCLNTHTHTHTHHPLCRQLLRGQSSQGQHRLLQHYREEDKKKEERKRRFSRNRAQPNSHSDSVVVLVEMDPPSPMALMRDTVMVRVV